VGVPQVILPVWFDLYGYAVRAEWLGIGIYANRGAEPTIDAPQLADALVRVLRDKEAEEGGRIRAKAGEVGRMCRRGRGDRRAADAILRAARGEDVLESSVLE
jgi:UDP:flavonoid glycosyltransferase YjiC (YdhE family)